MRFRAAFFKALALSPLWLGALGAYAQKAHPKTLERYDEVGPALLSCWRPPPGSEGMEITLIFSFKRNGEILGKPRISHTKLMGDLDEQKRFVASALVALARCTPLHISDGLGGAIAGHPFAMLFRAAPRQTGI